MTCRLTLKASYRSRDMYLGARCLPEKDFTSWAAYLGGMGAMELRHLRYFIAVAETGSLTEAAERRLHTSQPSLSRQSAIGIRARGRTASRGVRGVELTAAGGLSRLRPPRVDAGRCRGRSSTRAAHRQGRRSPWLPNRARVTSPAAAMHCGARMKNAGHGLAVRRRRRPCPAGGPRLPALEPGYDHLGTTWWTGSRSSS